MIKNLCSLQQMSALLLFIFCSLSFSSLAAHSNSVIRQNGVVKMPNADKQSRHLQGAYLWATRDTLLQRAAKTNKKQRLVAMNTLEGSESSTHVSFDFDENRYTLRSRSAVYAL